MDKANTALESVNIIWAAKQTAENEKYNQAAMNVKRVKFYWIKERHNPQLGVYYVRMGQISVREANQHDNPLYGHNILHRYETQEQYDAELARLEREGCSIYDSAGYDVKAKAWIIRI